MNRKTLKIVSAIIAGIFIFGLFTSVIFELAYAETSVQQKLNEAQKKKKDAQSKLNNAKQQKTKSLAEKENVTEKLKADNPMIWVQKMNNIRNRAMEVVNSEVIFV